MTESQVSQPSRERALPRDRFDRERSLTLGDIIDRLRERAEGERGSASILKGARAE